MWLAWTGLGLATLMPRLVGKRMGKPRVVQVLGLAQLLASACPIGQAEVIYWAIATVGLCLSMMRMLVHAMIGQSQSGKCPSRNVDKPSVDSA